MFLILPQVGLKEQAKFFKRYNKLIQLPKEKVGKVKKVEGKVEKVRKVEEKVEKVIKVEKKVEKVKNPSL